jgi:hypothetical protein
MLLSELTSFIDANRYKGRREAFGIKDTKNYLRWAFLHNYLFVTFDDAGISGVGVAYPLPDPYDGKEESLYAFKSVPSEDEEQKDICIMDLCAVNTKGRISLVSKFKRRFTNWENQRKWAIRLDNVSELSNKYINLIHEL